MLYKLFLTALAASLVLGGCAPAENSPANPAESGKASESATQETSSLPAPAGAVATARPGTDGSEAAKLKVAVLKVPGMTCGSCEGSVCAILNKIAGVKKADADGTSKTAVVEFDPDATTAEKIAAALGKAEEQYKATVERVS
jgi:mercuric ion binding protein